MGFISRNLALLRWSLLLAALLVMVGAVAAVVALRLRATAETRHREATLRQQEAQVRLTHTSVEETEIRRSIARFREMERRGLIGEEHRLEWLETIARSKTRRRLAEIDYELSPRRLLVAAQSAPEAGSHEFTASTMKLRLPLLHENDLLGFLDDLATDAQAMILPRSCEVTRRAPGPAEPNRLLQAECRIEWITVREKQR